MNRLAKIPTFGVQKLMEDFPDAWECLPEPYKNDDCLEFAYLDMPDFLFCRPKLEDIMVLGDWVFYFNPRSSVEWRDLKNYTSLFGSEFSQF